MRSAATKTAGRRVRFGDVVRQVKDKVDPAASGLDRYVAGEHMDTDDLRLRRWGEINGNYLGPAFHMRFKPGHVLYGSRRTYLRKVAVVDFSGICANTTFVLEPSDPSVLLPEFLPFLMQTEAFHSHSIKQSKGSVNPYVNFSDLAWWEFVLPPIEEQQRAVEVLGSAREVVDATRAAATAASVARCAWLRDTATRLLSTSERLVPLGDLLDGSPDSGCSAPERDIETGHWVLGLSALSGAGYVASEFKAVDPTPAMLSSRLNDGDLLISRSNTRERVGFVGRFVSDGRETSFPDTMMRLRPRLNRVSSQWLELVLQSSPIRGAIQSTAAGTSASMKKINRRNLLAIQVPELSRAKQDEYVGLWLALRTAESSVSERVVRAVDLNRKLLAEVLPP